MARAGQGQQLHVVLGSRVLNVPGDAGGHVRAWWGTLGLKDVVRYLQGQRSLRTVLDFSVSIKDEL